MTQATQAGPDGSARPERAEAEGAVDPYSPTQAVFEEVLPPRTRHATWAFLSAFLVLTAAWVLALLWNGRTPWSVGWLIPLRTLGMALVASIITGALLRPARRLKWYWAVLAAPLVAFTVIIVGVVVYYVLFEYRPGG